mgnify:CR=1 FL=1
MDESDYLALNKRKNRIRLLAIILNIVIVLAYGYLFFSFYRIPSDGLSGGSVGDGFEVFSDLRAHNKETTRVKKGDLIIAVDGVSVVQEGRPWFGGQQVFEFNPGLENHRYIYTLQRGDKIWDQEIELQSIPLANIFTPYLTFFTIPLSINSFGVTISPSSNIFKLPIFTIL